MLRPDDRRFQRVFWTVDGKIRVFELNTITFGVSLSPFLAIRTIHQLADDESANFPSASQILKRDLYVDNLLTGADTLNEILQIGNEIIALFWRGGFDLRQWASNHRHALDNIDEYILKLDCAVEKNTALNTLGLAWDSHCDKLVYTVKSIDIHKITKRIILSEIAKIFNPLGLLGPIVLTAKTLMQECWKAMIDWDESVPQELHSKWIAFAEQLNLVRNLAIDRQN